MNTTSENEFYTKHHESLTQDLNHISDDLLKAKWFFLASIATLGTAYFSIYDKVCVTQKIWVVWMVCLVGNVVFWLLTEYALSHAFLFRFIQSRLARIEILFRSPGNVKDPTNPKNFIDFEEDRLVIDKIIPDQFVPIYWASTWLIIINSIVSLVLMISFNHAEYPWPKLLWLNMAISCPLIWKLWTYYGYKIDKFLREHCHLEFVISEDPRSLNKHYFKFPFFPWFITLALAIVCYLTYLFCTDSNPFDVHMFLVCALGGYFFPVFLGILIHVLHIILRWDLHEISLLSTLFAPKLEGGTRNQDGNYEYIVHQRRYLRIFTLLYTFV